MSAPEDRRLLCAPCGRYEGDPVCDVDCPGETEPKTIEDWRDAYNEARDDLLAAEQVIARVRALRPDIGRLIPGAAIVAALDGYTP